MATKLRVEDTRPGDRTTAITENGSSVAKIEGTGKSSRKLAYTMVQAEAMREWMTRICGRPGEVFDGGILLGLDSQAHRNGKNILAACEPPKPKPPEQITEELVTAIKKWHGAHVTKGHRLYHEITRLIADYEASKEESK